MTSATANLRQFFALLCSALILLACTREHVGNERALSDAEIEAAFTSSDPARVDAITNQIIAKGMPRHFVERVKDVWNRGADSVPGADPTFVSGTAVRVYVANVLAQYWRTDEAPVDKAALQHVLRRGLDSDEPSVRRAAAHGLMAVGDESDYKRLQLLAH